MDTFTIGTRRTWFIRVMGHNTLVRRSDRIEAWSLVAAVLILAVATPIVCAFGTSTYDARARLYSIEMQHRHPVTATAAGDGDRGHEPGNGMDAARTKWNAAGQQNVDVVKWSSRAESDDQKRVWVDDNGLLVPPPRTSNSAATEASVLALGMWLGVFVFVAGVLRAIRWRLDIRRFAQWDLEMNKISEGGDRKNPQ